MIDPLAFIESLKQRGIHFHTGVPDSLLSGLCAAIASQSRLVEHMPAANEGNAVALALGYHLATNRVAAVYMQNSGLGNAINPLVSLADTEVYRTPMLLIVGWRGEPGQADEPQHRKQGRITLPQLELLGIPHHILDATSDTESLLSAVFDDLSRHGGPVAIVVRSGSFAAPAEAPPIPALSNLPREAALDRLLDLTSPEDLIIATTGKTSRELFELRRKRGELPRDFLTVGGMGHTASIALGVAIGRPDKRVVCLDGDGSLLMHLGSAVAAAYRRPLNLIHVVLNNGAHESVGSQPTIATSFDFASLGRTVGYGSHASADSLKSLDQAWLKVCRGAPPSLLELRIACGSRPDLGRPASSPEENKRAFMEAARE